MLRACRKLLRPAGRMAFFTIMIAPNLDARRHRIAARRGPRSVAARRPVRELMTSAGFEDVDVVDMTQEFLDVARAWFTEFARHEDELRRVLGDEWEQRQKERRDLMSGVEDGLLRRYLVSGTAP